MLLKILKKKREFNNSPEEEDAMIPASLPLPRISFMVVIVFGMRLDVERRRKNGFVDLSGEVHLAHEDDLRNDVPRQPQVRHAGHVVATLPVKVS